MSIDWHRDLDGKQVQRWSEKLGAALTCERDGAVLKLQEGRHPPDLPSDPSLLVIEVDGGRWQGREENPETHSRWREDKVCAIATYLPGDGKEQEPQRLLTTYTATVRDTEAFGPMCRLEAERRGLRQADQVIALADGGNWIDPLLALVVAANIVRTAFDLLVRSFNGLMDHALPEAEQQAVRHALDALMRPGLHYHALRTRQAGARKFVDFHLLVPGTWSVKDAHDFTERVEEAVRKALPGAEVTVHIEPIEAESAWKDSELLGVEKPSENTMNEPRPSGSGGVSGVPAP